MQDVTVVLRKQQEKTQVYPVHHVLDDTQPVVFALDSINGLLLAQVMANVIEVAVKENLPLPLSLDHHFPFLILFGPYIVKLPLLDTDNMSVRYPLKMADHSSSPK